MPLSRKSIFTLISLLIIYSWFFISTSLFKKSAPPVTVASNNVYLYIQPQDGKSPIINAINSAQKEILIEVYLLSDKDVIESIKNAKTRGVNVKIILEQHPYGGNNLNNKTKQELDKFGVPTKWANPKFTLTHQKTILIDSNKAFILNQNLTLSSFTRNREYNILDTIPSDINQLRSIFLSDWEGKNFTPISSNLIYSPDNSRKSIISLINKANKSIDIETEVINDRQIVGLLVERSKTIQIRLLIPTLTQIQGNKLYIEELSKNGIKVKTLANPYIHAKLILVDKKYAYSGSINLTTQSMDENREVGILLSDANILTKLSSTFESDWNLSTDLNN